MGCFAPCGYVAPQYYDSVGLGFLNPLRRVCDHLRSGYQECCYYYDAKAQDGIARAGIYSPSINKGVVLSYDKRQLPCFVEWKMMGKNDYVLGLEPDNCTPDGRDVLRKNGTLRFLEPNESGTTAVEFTFVRDVNEFEGSF